MDETLDIALLRTFLAIEEHGGFGRAADALHRSQPTVSQHVRALERRLGHPLVEKDGRGARFTAHGKRLLAEARRIVAVHDEALRRLRADAPSAPASSAPAPSAPAPEAPEPERPALDAAGAAQVTGFLHFVAERMPQLIGEWDAERAG